ncbi:50S ribosomal protein L22 [Candidatus Micrarchaeota archaeon]|nr:50S ribosomal protein L22 [Candidatus Micrarchaeota archaeon]
MKGYSAEFERENFATARSEDNNISYKDASEVCGRIRGKHAEWAVGFLELASEGEIPVLYKRHCKKLGHRRELGGRKGRYPKKAAGAVLKTLMGALANGKSRGMGEKYLIMHAAANKKNTFGRVAPKGRWARSDYETSRIEIVLKPLESIPKGVEVRAPQKKEEHKHEVPKKEEAKHETPKQHEAHAHEHGAHETKHETPKQHEAPKQEVKHEAHEVKHEAHDTHAHEVHPAHEAKAHETHAHEHEAPKHDVKPESKREVKK